VVALGEKCIVSDLACLLSIHCHNTMHGSKAPFIHVPSQLALMIVISSFWRVSRTYIFWETISQTFWEQLKNCKHIRSSQNHWTTIQKLQTACVLWKPHFCRTWCSIIAEIARIQDPYFIMYWTMLWLKTVSVFSETKVKLTFCLFPLLGGC